MKTRNLLNIDEIYCSVSELNNTELNQFINFADNNLKTLKFLPDNKNIYSKKLASEGQMLIRVKN